MPTYAVPSPIYQVADIRAIEARHLTQLPLMERAGAAAANIALRMLEDRVGPVLVLCGPGNNGGDGFVLARHLRVADRDVTVCFVADESKLPADAAAALAAWKSIGGNVVSEWPRRDYALVVDAMFGIGLTRAIDGIYAEWIARLNALTCPRLALDVPSGLDADRGIAHPVCVRATHTATFIALKPGLLTADGPDCCGEITVASLEINLEKDKPPRGLRVSPALFAEFLKARPRNSHKGTNGNAGIVGGAPGMVGAALLGGRAALKLGAGRVFVGLLDTCLAVDPQAPELMLRSADDVLKLADGLVNALALGPGLGESPAALELLSRAIDTPAALVLDADALNLLAQHPVLAARLKRRAASAIITPHPAEAARLLQTDTAAIQADRIAAATQLAASFNAVAVLKGAGSIIATPDGRWFINPTGNPGMASAGMGDVLTGMVAALLGQGWSLEAALMGAVWLHGHAADRLFAEGIGPIGMTAGELLGSARSALNAIVLS